MNTASLIQKILLMGVAALIAAMIAVAQAPPAQNPQQSGFNQIPANANADEAHPQGTNLAIYRFTERCAGCHDTAKGGAPERYELTKYTPEQILASMTGGKMAQYAKGLKEIDMKVVAVYAGGRPLGSSDLGDSAHMANQCTEKPPLNNSVTGSWNGFGVDATNARFQTTANLTADQVPRLKLKWAFGFPMGNSFGRRKFVGGNHASA